MTKSETRTQSDEKTKKKTHIKFNDWNNRWGRHTLRQDKSSIAKPLCHSTLL